MAALYSSVLKKIFREPTKAVRMKFHPAKMKSRMNQQAKTKKVARKARPFLRIYISLCLFVVLLACSVVDAIFSDERQHLVRLFFFEQCLIQKVGYLVITQRS